VIVPDLVGGGVLPDVPVAPPTRLVTGELLAEWRRLGGSAALARARHAPSYALCHLGVAR